MLNTIKLLFVSLFLLEAPIEAAAAETLEVSDEAAFSLISAQKNSTWTGLESIEAIEEALEKQSITALYDMRSYIGKTGKTARFRNKVYIVLLADGTKAVFKPKAPEEQESALAEVAAYQCAKHLAVYTSHLLVPPTVMKTLAGGRTGSLQYFVESSSDLWIDEQRNKAMSSANPAIVNEAALFIEILGQWDIHPGNWLVTDGYMVCLIDNEGIVNRKYSLASHQRPYVRISYNEELVGEKQTFASLEGSSIEDFQHIFGKHLPKSRIKSLCDTFNSQDGSGAMHYMIGNGGVWIQYHAKNPRAFPLVPIDYVIPHEIKEGYASMCKHLPELFDPLLKFNLERFSGEFLEEIKTRMQSCFPD